MLIQIIHISRRFHVLDVEFIKSLKQFLLLNIFHLKATNGSP